MRHSSRHSAGATYLDREQRISELRAAAGRAHQRIPTIQRVVLFGSLVRGTPSPRSDADLLVVVDRSDHAQSRDRTPDLLAALAPLPCPVDLFVLTRDEVARAMTEQSPLVREALEHGVDLL